MGRPDSPSGSAEATGSDPTGCPVGLVNVLGPCEKSVSIDSRGVCVGISVKDEGLGIPPGEQHDIFRRFVRGERAMRMGIKGTGLGLAMVSHIIQAHKGSIELASEENVGSTFTIVLPVVS